MKPPQGVRLSLLPLLPLLLILSLDLFGLLAFPMAHAYISASRSPLATFGVRPPECEYETWEGFYDGVRQVVVVLHADGSTVIKGRVLDAEGLREDLFVRADSERDLENPDWPSTVTLALVADRGAEWKSVVDLLELSLDPALAFRRLNVHFVQPDRLLLECMPFYLGDPGDDLCVTVRAAPNETWERVLTAILAELPPESGYAGLRVSDEPSTSKEIEVTVTGE